VIISVKDYSSSVFNVAIDPLPNPRINESPHAQEALISSQLHYFFPGYEIYLFHFVEA
jgi:hypothetical protein